MVKKTVRFEYKKIALILILGMVDPMLAVNLTCLGVKGVCQYSIQEGDGVRIRST